MNYPYIGDRQLDPDDDHECPHCGCEFTTDRALMRHMSKCPESPYVDPEPEIDQ